MRSADALTLFRDGFKHLNGENKMETKSIFNSHVGRMTPLRFFIPLLFSFPSLLLTAPLCDASLISPLPFVFVVLPQLPVSLSCLRGPPALTDESDRCIQRTNQTAASELVYETVPGSCPSAHQSFSRLCRLFRIPGDLSPALSLFNIKNSRLACFVSQT